MRYLDSLALAKLRGLSSSLRKLGGEGVATGAHSSRLKGFSQEFSQYRPYAPGDDLRSIDWKVMARADRPYVRENESESLMGLYLLMDASGSMAYASGAESKWDYACRLAMALAYLALSQGDAVGLAVFDSRLRVFLPPQSLFSRLQAVDSILAKTSPAGRLDLGAVLSEAAPRLKARSLIAVFSDFLGPPAGFLRFLKGLKAKRRTWAVQVLDPAERDFDFQGPAFFESLEDSGSVFLDARDARRAYHSELSRLLRYYRAALESYGIPHAVNHTDEPWDRGLSRLLTRS